MPDDVATTDRRRMLRVEDAAWRRAHMHGTEGAFIIWHLRRQGTLERVRRIGVCVVEHDIDAAPARRTRSCEVDPHLISALVDAYLDADGLFITVRIDGVFVDAVGY